MKQAEKKNPLQAFLPIIGLVLIVIAGAIAFFASAPAHDFLMDQFPGQIPNQDVVQYAVGGIIFLLIILFVALIYAAFQPKPEMTVTERELDREKKERERERLERKKRQKRMKERMRKANKE